MLAGTCMYQPHKWAPRAIKKTVIGMMKMGWKAAAGILRKTDATVGKVNIRVVEACVNGCKFAM